jgi:uncharacterized protein (DUF2235 family)
MEPLDPQPPKVFVLCFDGTGNKFNGDESDSNVLKIFRVSLLSFDVEEVVTDRGLSDA